MQGCRPESPHLVAGGCDLRSIVQAWSHHALLACGGSTAWLWAHGVSMGPDAYMVHGSSRPG